MDPRIRIGSSVLGSPLFPLRAQPLHTGGSLSVDRPDNNHDRAPSHEECATDGLSTEAQEAHDQVQTDAPAPGDAPAFARQRSSSPWHFRIRSAEGSGGSTPVIGRSYAGARVLSGTRTASVVQAAARASYESALLAAVRRQIEVFEEKVGGQIARIQSQSDRTREGILARLEEKISAAESLQPKLDRRLAELGGNFKGLSDEMQTQIRRVDLMDDRLWEWRHQMEEELRHKYADFEQNVQKVTSGFRIMTASIEENQKRQQQRLQRIEADLGERFAIQEELCENFKDTCTRLEALEDHRMDDESMANGISRALVLSEPPADSSGGHRGSMNGVDDLAHTTLYKIVSQRVEDISERLDHTFQDSHDLHSRLASQEEQVKTLRTIFDTREDHLRVLVERVDRGDWDSKVERINQASQQDGKIRLEQSERLELLSRRVDFLEQAQEELSRSQDVLLQSQDEDPLRRGNAPGEISDDVAASLQACFERLAESETRIAALSTEFQVVSSETNLAPRVGALVAQLKDIVPKVIDHERAIRDLKASAGEDRLEEAVLQLRSEVSILRAEGIANVASKQAFAEKQDLQEATAAALQEELRELKGSQREQALQQQSEQLLLRVSVATEQLSQSIGCLKDLEQGLEDKLRNQRHGFEKEQQELSACLEGLRAELVSAVCSDTHTADRDRDTSKLASLLASVESLEETRLESRTKDEEDADRLKASLESQFQGLRDELRCVLRESLESQRGQLDTKASTGDSAKLQAALDGLKDELEGLKVGDSCLDFALRHHLFHDMCVDNLDSSPGVASTLTLRLLLANSNITADHAAAVPKIVKYLEVYCEASTRDSVQLQAALDGFKDELEGLKASNGSNSELQRMLESQRGELDSIKASTRDSVQLQAALDGFKDELEGLKASNGSNSELQRMLESQRGELDSIKASTRDSVQLQAALDGFKDELEGLKVGDSCLDSPLVFTRSLCHGKSKRHHLFQDMCVDNLDSSPGVASTLTLRLLLVSSNIIADHAAAVPKIVKYLEVYCEASTRDSVQLQAALDGFKDELEGLKAGCASTRDSVQLQAALDGFKDELEGLKASTRDSVQLQAALDGFKDELEGLKASTRDSVQLQAALDGFKDELEGLKASNGSTSELQRMLESQRGELDSIKASTRDSVQLQAALDGFKDELEGLKASNGSNSELQSILESQRGELDSIKASTGDSSKLQAALDGLKDELEGLKASNGSNSELQSMLESQRGELDSIKASTGDSSKLQAALDSLKDELEGLKAACKSSSLMQLMLPLQSRHCNIGSRRFRVMLGTKSSARG
ncbi:unnamed protein product [Polarella glacialis]|uniref:Uncharacterized protein n=1 Tax=Polarella glacialis TaxID=89957 RepID=A0A813IS97_POLGL|nr:unnamed protein product [Polarella glacialis]